MPVAHLKSIYAEGEQLDESTILKFRIVRKGSGRLGDQLPLLPHQSLRIQRGARTFRQVL